MLANFRTAALLVLAVISVSLVDVSDGSVIRKARPIRVLRAVEKTRLSDGTKFERYVESGQDLPPLPIEAEDEEADDLNDPRIGHLDDHGDIAVPVDAEGKVLKGFEYLLKPITFVIDLDEKDEDGKLKIAPVASDARQNVADPYQDPNAIRPKTDFLSQQETVGEEYDDVQTEPAEPLPKVPNLPKADDYSDSGESDEDLKFDNVDEEEQEDSNRRPGTGEVIIPSSLIEQPIVKDEVEEKSGPQGSDDSEASEGRSEGSEVAAEEIDEESRANEPEESDDQWTDENVEDLANELAKDVRDKVLNELMSWNEVEYSEVSEYNQEDPNSILSSREQVIDASDDQDGVVLSEDGLSADEIAKIAAESLKPDEPAAVPEVPIVNQGGVGGRLVPDSAAHPSISLLFLISSFVFLFFR